MIQSNCSGLVISYKEDPARFVIFNETTHRTSNCSYNCVISKKFTNVDDSLAFFRSKKGVSPDTVVILNADARDAIDDIVKHNVG